MIFNSSIQNKNIIIPPPILIKLDISGLYFFIEEDKNIEINAIMAIFSIIFAPKI